MPHYPSLVFSISNLNRYLETVQRRIIIICLIVFLSHILCHAQYSGYTAIQYNTDNGLPQSSVKSIVFDKMGYCWLATEVGLVRFDGKNFKAFGMSEIPGITTDRIKQLIPDLSGDLYAYTGNDEKILVNAKNPPRSPFPQVIKTDLHFIPRAGYVTKNAHIDSLYKDIFTREPHPPGYEGKVDDQGNIYTNVHRRLYYVTKQKASEIFDNIQVLGGWEQTMLSGKYYVHLYLGNKIKVWKNGVYQPGKNSISGPIADDKNYLSGKSRVLLSRESAYIYSGKKLFRLYMANGNVDSELIFDDLNIPDLACMYYSKEQGKYYFGSYTAGLFIVEPPSFKYPQVPKEAPSEIFYPQALTKDGRIFSRDILFSRTGDSQYLPLKSHDCRATYVTTQNQLYYESFYTLYRYDLNTNRNQSIIPIGWRLRSIFPDDPSNLIYSTAQSFGIISNDTLVKEQRFPENTNVSYVLRLDKSKFLLASNKGVKWYDMNQNRFYKSILESLHIRNIHQDSGKLWISSEGKGFFLYEKDKLYSLPFGPKESMRLVHAFIDDGNGYFWLPTNNGLFKVRKADLVAYAKGKIPHVYFYMFTKQNGLRTNEFNGAADRPYIWTNDGMLSLPSMNGLVWFYPAKTQLHYPDKKIYFDQILIDDSKTQPGKDEIKLEPDFDNFTISVSSPYFGNPENIQLEYKITGLSDHWKSLPPDGNISIGQSPSGNYKLLVRRLSPDRDELLELGFEVRPWFYNTWWFYLIILLSFTLVAYLISRQRLKNIREKAKQLEALVDERTKELSVAIEQIAESESALMRSTKVKDRVITMVLHDLRSPIRFLGTISDYLVSNYQNLEEAQLKERLTELQSGAKALRGFTENFFTWAVSQHENFRVTNTLIKIQVLFDELGVLYSDIVKERGNVLTIESTSHECHTDYQMLALILRNLIDNANKNTANGIIKLSATTSKNSVSFHISDTGRGLTQEQVNSFIDESKGMGSTGVGSILILNMIQKIGGKLEILTSIENGSTFTVILNHPPLHGADEQG